MSKDVPLYRPPSPNPAPDAPGTDPKPGYDVPPPRPGFVPGYGPRK